ncbi:MAG: hypothetical protein JXX14_07675 [Deltaproteobacteria bacterium]|nr:hypothetical protein [Deltaproteobacteria bacterium]
MNIFKTADSRKNLVIFFLIWKIITLVLLGVVINDWVWPFRTDFISDPSPLKSYLNWDASWYIQIARDGYANEMARAFYPAFPYSIRWCSWGILDEVVCGIVLTTIYSMLFACIYFKMAEALFSSRIGALALVLFLCTPAAYFLSCIYTESFFLLLLFTFLWLFLNKKSYWAAVPAILMVFTRGQGFFVALATGIIFLMEIPAAIKTKKFETLSYNFLIGLSFLIGTLLFMAYQYWQFDNPFEFIRVQDKYFGEYFNNSLANCVSPSHIFDVFFSGTGTVFSRSFSIFDKTFFYLAVILLPLVWKTDRRLFVFYFSLFYFPATMGDLGSFGRFFLLPFSIAALCCSKWILDLDKINIAVKNVLLIVIVFCSFTSQAVLCLLHAAYWWIA